MLFDEREMLEVCKKYGIEIVEKEGYPIYMRNEINPNISADEIMNDNVVDKVVYTNEVTITIPFDKTNIIIANCNVEIKQNTPYYLNIHKDESYEKITSTIYYENDNRFAA